MVWTKETPGCEETTSEIFHGQGNLQQRVGAPDLLGSIVLLKHNEMEQFAGLVLKAVTNACGARCFSTQVHGLIVCPY